MIVFGKNEGIFLKKKNSIEKLRVLRDNIIEKWKKQGILDGLSKDIPEKIATLFDAQDNFIIQENIKEDTFDFDNIQIPIKKKIFR